MPYSKTEKFGMRQGGAGAFGGEGETSFWWTATETMSRYLNNYNNTESNGIVRQLQPNVIGQAVRCVKD